MAWPQDAYVGQDVVCVQLLPIYNALHKADPIVVGAKYKISAIEYIDAGIHKGLWFTLAGGGLQWWAVQFRPVLDKDTSTSMDQLLKLQDPKNHQQVLMDKFDRTRAPEPVKH